MLSGKAGIDIRSIARQLGVPANTMSTHLALLEQAGLATARRAGRSVIYSADFAGMRALLTYLTEECCQGRPEICGPLVARAAAGDGACGAGAGTSATRMGFHGEYPVPPRLVARA